MRRYFFVNYITMTAIVVLFVLVSSLIARSETPVYRSSVTVQVALQPRASDTVGSLAQGSALLARDLAYAVSTADFLNLVLQSGYDISDERLKNPSTQRELWKSAVKARSNGSFVIIDVNYTDKRDTRLIISAITKTIAQRHLRWYPFGVYGTVRVTENPIVETVPYRPNEFLTVFGGMLLGIFVGGVVLLVQHRIRNHGRVFNKHYRATTVSSKKLASAGNVKSATNNVSQKTQVFNYSKNNNTPASQETKLPDVLKLDSQVKLQTGILPMSDPNRDDKSDIVGRNNLSDSVGGSAVERVSNNKADDDTKSPGGKFYYMGQVVE